MDTWPIRFLTLTILTVALLTAGCSTESDWQQALEAAAPDNPDRLSRVQNPEPEAEPEQSSQQEQQRPTAEGAGEQTAEQQAPALLTITVAGLESCRYGAVRCLIDRRYYGALNEAGELTVEIPPGVYQGELVDSEGQWNFVASLSPGSSNTINLTCADKVYFGEPTLGGEAVEPSEQQ